MPRFAIADSAQGYAASVRQLGAGPLRVYGLHALSNIASTLIVLTTLRIGIAGDWLRDRLDPATD